MSELQAFLNVIANPRSTPPERAEAGRQLAEIGDPRPGVGVSLDGIPDIDWVKIPVGEFVYGDQAEKTGQHKINISTFYISRYPITYIQYQAFTRANDGYISSQWWTYSDEAERWREDNPQPQPAHSTTPNQPRDTISWYESLAFCRWLSSKLDFEVYLPTEQEWEKAARGTTGRVYPWGNEYIPGYANIDETRSLPDGYYLRSTAAVGSYPQGASPYGVLDMSGNLCEWCVNEYENPSNIRRQGNVRRVARGGAWNFNLFGIRTTYRIGFESDFQGNTVGFRCVHFP